MSQSVILTIKIIVDDCLNFFENIVNFKFFQLMAFINAMKMQYKVDQAEVAHYFICRSGSNIELFNIQQQYSIFINQCLTQYFTMRKQIVFEQNSTSSCLVNVKNIFGFSINYVQDKIKKHDGKWDSESRKFQVPLSQICQLTKQLQTIDRSFYIQQIPSSVGELCAKFSPSSTSHKVKKQILIDNNIVKRYQYIQENVLKNILSNCKQKNGHENKYYNKILIVTMQWKIPTWIQQLIQHKVKRIKFQNKQHEMILKQECIWIVSYQQIWTKYQQIIKYCFQTFVVDEAEILGIKITAQKQAALTFKKLLINRHFNFFIISKLYLNRLDILLPLLSIMMPTNNLSWFSRRYRKQNLIQLNYLIKTCSLTRDLNISKQTKQQNCKHFFNKFILYLSESAVQKIKQTNRKNSQLEQRKILQNPSAVRNKNQRIYFQAISQILRQEKQEQIHKLISYYCIELNIRVALIIQTNSIYRSIENYLCEQQITYCHYQHPNSVIQFNKNPTILVILVKSHQLLTVSFTNPLHGATQSINEKLQNYQPEQYLCISGVRHVLFPDLDWSSVNLNSETKKKQQKYWDLFRFSCSNNKNYSGGDLVRHYFIIKSTYEQKWMTMLQENIIKIQMNLKVKEDIQEQEEQQEEANQVMEGNSDPAFGFCQLNLAKVQEQYSHLKVIKGITDIDEEFDRLEYEALQQKIRRESKKKIKEEKARQKLAQAQQNFSQLQKKSEKIIVQQKPVIQIHCNQQQFDIFLEKNKPQSVKSDENQCEQLKQVSIYEPVQQNKVPIEAKTTQQQNIDKKVNKNQQKIQNSSIQLQKSERYKKIQQKLYEQLEDQYKQIFNKQQLKDEFKQDETQQVQIIEVRKPTKKPKIPKPKAQVMSIILRPKPIN